MKVFEQGGFPESEKKPRIEPAVATTVFDHGDRRHVVNRAAKYLALVPGAIQGSGGDQHTYVVACKLVKDFDLTESESYELLSGWNRRCEPPWSDEELREKIRNAGRYANGAPGSLRDAPYRGSLHVENDVPVQQTHRGQQDSADSDELIVPAHWKRLDVADIQNWQCEPLRPLADGIIALLNFVIIAAQSQTGKTLLGFYLARKFVQGGLLFGKYAIKPVTRVEYFLLEDPDRRAQDRILDTEHEFEPLEPGRFIINVAPGFTLTDDRMFEWFEQTLSSKDGEDVVAVLDTYQKATPGLNSFDDAQQGVILHKLANITRRRGVTLIVMDHFRKGNNGGGGKGKARELTIDDIKGTGGKAQNADCVILLDRTADKKQIKFQSFSKDFDNPVRILLDVSPRGSKEPKFKHAGDLDQLGARSHGKTEARRLKVLESMKGGEWLSIAEIADALRVTDKGLKTLQRDLNTLVVGDKLDSTGETKHRRYCRAAESIGQNA